MGQFKAKEMHKGQSIIDEILDPSIEQVVQRLDYQNFEYQNCFKGRKAAFASIRIGSGRLIQSRSERFKIVCPRKCFE